MHRFVKSFFLDNISNGKRDYEFKYYTPEFVFEVSPTDLDFGIEASDWDFVTMQQVSGKSGKYETFQPYALAWFEIKRRHDHRAVRHHSAVFRHLQLRHHGCALARADRDQRAARAPGVFDLRDDDPGLCQPAPRQPEKRALCVHRVPMEKFKTYNVRKAVWHNILVSADAKVLVIENDNTSEANSEYRYF